LAPRSSGATRRRARRSTFPESCIRAPARVLPGRAPATMVPAIRRGRRRVPSTPCAGKAKPHVDRGASRDRHIAVASFRRVTATCAGAGPPASGCHAVRVIDRFSPHRCCVQHRRDLAAANLGERPAAEPGSRERRRPRLTPNPRAPIRDANYRRFRLRQPAGSFKKANGICVASWQRP
jgi:hypothetical protein